MPIHTLSRLLYREALERVSCGHIQAHFLPASVLRRNSKWQRVIHESFEVLISGILEKLLASRRARRNNMGGRASTCYEGFLRIDSPINTVLASWYFVKALQLFVPSYRRRKKNPIIEVFL